MQHWTQLLSTIERVEALHYPHMRESRKRPDPLLAQWMKVKGRGVFNWTKPPA